MSATQPDAVVRKRPKREQRRHQIIKTAASLFAAKGFDATSMRDIAADLDMNAGSLYYHFKSKEQLFVAVHSAGVNSLLEAVKARIQGLEDPWERLEEAAAAHCEALFDSADLMILLVPKFPSGIDAYRHELIKQRDKYEEIIRGLVADLPLPQHIDRNVFRLHFIGALNWTQTWYRPGSRLSADEIGRQLVWMLRC